jgi:DNA topoisomerase I
MTRRQIKAGLLLTRFPMRNQVALPRTWQRLKAEQRRVKQRAAALPARLRATGAVDPVASAKVAGLRYVNDETTAGIRRLGKPNRFRYVNARARVIRNRAELERIRSLAVPPAWTEVWICPDPRGHLQATGRDARGRKQYRYHPQWREVRDEVKYGRLIAFAQALPRIRRRTAADLKKHGLTRERVLAAVVQLLEKTLIRIGNEEYARENRSYGLTTMRDQHAKVAGAHVNFEFRGKSGIQHAVDLHDERLARIVKACRDLPGYELFQYVDENGRRQIVDSADVNAYLRELSGQDFTAKDFRTWAGTVMAAGALAGVAFKSAAEAKRNIVKAIDEVAKRLGNTKAVCRKSYIHPAVFDAYMEGLSLMRVAARRARAARALRSRHALRPEEAAVVGLLERRLLKTA